MEGHYESEMSLFRPVATVIVVRYGLTPEVISESRDRRSRCGVAEGRVLSVFV